MAHYWDDVPPTPLELKQATADRARQQLRGVSAGCFTVDELALVLRCGWADFKYRDTEDECDRILALFAREFPDKELR